MIFYVFYQFMNWRNFIIIISVRNHYKLIYSPRNSNIKAIRI